MERTKMSKTGCGLPYFYRQENAVNGTILPSFLHIRNTAVANFYKRYLTQKAISQFRFTLPNTWNKDYFLYTLYIWGFLAVVRTDKFGVIPQGCSLMGYDVFYRPTNAVISNPMLKGIIKPRIGTQCTLIKLQPDYGSIYDLVDFYGNMLALCAESASVNLLNSRLAYVFLTGNKQGAETMKKAMDKILSGEPGVFVDKDMFRDENGELNWEMFEQNLSQNFITPEIMEVMRTWEEKFDVEIGIPTTNTQKKERLVTGEVEANQMEAETRLEMWFEGLRESFEETRQMFGIPESELNVEMRKPKGGDSNGYADTDGNGDV
mgnify:CR=1 FL=1